jgi:uncharacterized protein
MNFTDAFYNEFGRLRSGWRFSIFLLAFIFLSAFAVVGAIAILSKLPIGFTKESLAAFVVPFVITSFIAIFLGWLFGKLFEDLPFRALGVWFTKNWLKDLVSGSVLGAVSIGIAALIAFAFGGMRFETNQNSGNTAIFLTLAITLLIFIFGAIAEEVLFRGYLLQTMSRAKLAWIGIVITSFLFATGHNNNPGASIFSWVNTFLAGIWLCAAYLKTRNLWFPFGIHLMWNWVQGAFFGINVSGLSELASAPLMHVSETGNALIGGGDYGIEGGIACTIALVISTALIWFLPIFKPTEEMLALTSDEKPNPNLMSLS